MYVRQARRFGFRSVVTLAGVLSFAYAAAPGCGSSGSTFAPVVGGGGDGGGSGDGGTFGDAGFNTGPCEGLECLVANCGSAPPTTVSGTVYAPNGTLPLYNVVVYVPNAPLDPIPEGPTCDRCGSVSGKPITSALTDTNGRFTLKNVPVGSDIPVVIQVGKWRREVKLPKIEKCVDNPVTDANLLRLPKNKSEGHIPKIAVTTGVCDHLACLLPKLGLDASEYTPKSGDGRLNLFKGSDDTCDAGADGGANCTGAPAPAPAGTPPATDLWKDVDSLKPYDMVVLSCECNEHNETKPDSSKTALYEYSKLGGRVFASHFHYTWFANHPLPEVRAIAEWKPPIPGVTDPYGQAFGGMDPPFYVDESFPKGKAFSDWLEIVNASTVKGQIPINQPRRNVAGVNASTSTRWIYNKPLNLPETTKYFSFNTPVNQPPDNQCGKAVFGDMHISDGVVDADAGIFTTTTTLPDNGFPATCPKDLTPPEKALIFLFFDLASCVQKEKDPPAPPK